jgi:hypothetical protein
MLPQVLDLFHDRPAVCKKVLALDDLDGRGGKSGVQHTKPSTDEEYEGAADFVVNAQANSSDSDIYTYLSELATRAASRALRESQPRGEAAAGGN